YRVALRLAPRPCCRRHADHRQQRRLRLAVAAIVGHHAAIRQAEIDALRAVERAASSNRDDGVDAERSREYAPRFDHGAVGVAAEILKQEHVGPGGLEQSSCCLTSEE